MRKFVKKLICRIRGHVWKDRRSYLFAAARYCVRCKHGQVWDPQDKWCDLDDQEITH